jgi:CDP-diacylglycerol---glycerol-3-phosphate 3-phosphatidyltransferase
VGAIDIMFTNLDPEGYTIKAGELGKTKMMLQVVGVSMVMLSMRNAALRPYALLVMWLVVVAGLTSAVDYFRKFWRKVDMGIKLRRRNQLIELERQKRRLLRAERKEQIRASVSRDASSIHPGG